MGLSDYLINPTNLYRANLRTNLCRTKLSFSCQQCRNITNQSTRIANARFYNGYAPAKKWVIVATIANPQSRDFKR